MRSMTSDGARKWCSQDAVRLSLTRDEVLGYKSAGKHKLFVTAPQEHRGIIVLARTILLFRGEADFTGGLLWLRRWYIGSPQLVRVGWRILEEMRRGNAESRSLEVAPA